MKIRLSISKTRWKNFYRVRSHSLYYFSCVYLSKNGIHRHKDTGSFKQPNWQTSRTFYKEIFKYLKKYQIENSVNLKSEIIKHLIKKIIKQNSNMKDLKELKFYSSFLFKLFNNINSNTEIFLVFQKKMDITVISKLDISRRKNEIKSDNK